MWLSRILALGSLVEALQNATRIGTSFVFGYLGITFFSYISLDWSWQLFIAMLIICCAGRFIGTIGIIITGTIIGIIVGTIIGTVINHRGRYEINIGRSLAILSFF